MQAARPYILLLFCLTLGETSAQEAKWEDAAGEGIESASRDLKNLQSREPKVGTRAMVEDPVPLPFVMPGSTTPSGTSAAGSRSSPSQGWLLDALNSQQHQSRFQSRSGERRELDLPPLREENRPNPLNGYLQTWLSARDRDLLLPKVDRAGHAQPALAAGSEPAWRPRSNIDSTALTADARRGYKLGNSENPYLDAQTPAAALNFDGTPPSRKQNTLDAMPAVVLPQATTGHSALPELAPSLAEPAAAPTAPLVDERRYFPQLRRF